MWYFRNVLITSLLLIISTFLTFSFSQEKEFKKINNQINNINLNQQELSNLFIDTKTLINEYPLSPLGYFANSHYYNLLGSNVDSAYFHFRKSNDLFLQLDEKTQANYCKKFNICEETLAVDLDSLAIHSLNYYAKNKSSNQVKIFLDKYPKDSKAYFLGLELYERFRFEELKNSKNIQLHKVFIVEFPQSKYATQVISKIDQLAYDEIKYSSDTSAYFNYLNEYPLSVFRDDAEIKLTNLREALIENEFSNCNGDANCLLKFIEKHPNAKQTNLAYKKVIYHVETMFSIGNYNPSLKQLKTLSKLNSSLSKSFSVDSLIYKYEYNSCKIDNDVLKWNIYLQTYPQSPWFQLAEKQRDSLEFKRIVYSSKNLSSSKYLFTLEEFVKSHPNSVYTANADEIIKKIKSESDNKKSEEQSFIKRYAVFNDKILRLFVNENVLYSEYNKIRPDKRFLAGGKYRDGYEVEIGVLESFWSETNDYHLKNFRRDTITTLKTRILEDYGINLADFPLRNADKRELDYILDKEADDTVVLKNYVTTSISKVDEHGICYLAGFFINSKRYQKDIDCFIAKVNCNETDLGKKVIWLNEFSELTVEAINMNDWAFEIKAEDNHIYMESLNDKKEYTIYKFAAGGEQLWKKKVSEIDPKLAKINILSNGDLIIFGHSDYAYDDMCFTILSSQNGAVVKTTKKIANDPDGYFGTLVTTNNEFVVAINYLKYGEGADKQTSFGRALEINNSVGVNLPNIMLLKYNNKGELINQRIIKSVEPRIIKNGNFENGKILFEGERGKNYYDGEWGQNNYDGEFISKYFLEIDEKLNVISTNGSD
jgi:outer membrane protein assembly factor BamD (BamD/ComL family)